MAAAFRANLSTQRDSTDLSTYNFTVTAPISGDTVFAMVGGRKASGVADPTSVSGLGLTWTKVVGLSNAAGTLSVSMWVGTGTPSGATTFTVNVATWVNCDISLLACTNVDTTTPTAQSGSAEGTSTTGLVTLGSAPTSGFVVGGLGHQTNEAGTAGSGFTGFNTNGANPNTQLIGEYQAANDQTIDATWTTSSAWVAVGAEVNSAGTNATATPTEAVLVLDVPAPTILADATVTPTEAVLVLLVPAPTIVVGVTVTPTEAVLTWTVDAPVITASATPTPTEAVLVLLVPAPTITASATPTPTEAILILDVPAPTITTSANATATPTEVILVWAVPAPTIGGVSIVDIDWVMSLIGFRWADQTIEGTRWSMPEGAIMRTAWSAQLEGQRWTFGSITEER